MLPRIKARLYFGHATKDRSMPQEAIENFDRALAAWGGKYQSEVYEGAFHGWTVADAPVDNQPEAERAYEKLTELFAEYIEVALADGGRASRRCTPTASSTALKYKRV